MLPCTSSSISQWHCRGGGAKYRPGGSSAMIVETSDSGNTWLLCLPAATFGLVMNCVVESWCAAMVVSTTVTSTTTKM